ncbi:TIGR02217 family protein [Martelella alba]|uniref:TIGR02217 family protein n=1 Tax=Martelella alba TaxID=2590451 RepID=A0A506U6H3_9HYPH|nr:TIGR02217 family protein [Martelella alba]TPW29440.1 TIGR02217 family protein [Martelella alba]
MSSGFHDVRFPLRLSLATSGGPVRRTDIVNLSNGRENRNQRWFDSRRSYDAGSGLKSLEDLYELMAFFEARRGQLFGFRFRDPVDFKSCSPLQTISATDQFIATGDGTTASFQLIKTYGDVESSFVRSIEKPVAGTLKVSVDGAVVSGVALDAATGVMTFSAEAIPAAGAAIFAGFEFDVPVRFDIDRIEVNLKTFSAGMVPSVPLAEIKP